MPAPLVPRSTADRLGRSVLFLVSAVPAAAAGLAVLVTGWSLLAGVLVTPLVVPVAVGFAAVVRLAGRAEAAVARSLLGIPVAPAAAPPPPSGFWRRGVVAVSAGPFWRVQGYLALRVLVGLPVTSVWLGMLAAGLHGVAAPITYRWIPQGDEWRGIDLGLRRIDTLPESLLLVPAGLVVVAVTVALAPALAAWWRRPAQALLGGNMEGVAPGNPHPPFPADRTVAARPGAPHDGRPALVTHALVTAALGLVLVGVWALTTRGSFWPRWPLLALAALVAAHAAVVAAGVRRPDLARRRIAHDVAVHAGVALSLVGFLVGVWALTGFGYPWPAWPALGLAAMVAMHWLVAQRRRIDQLETARTDAVTVQETDLRRIERDLHDGAQARLVALGMHLGLAEQKLASDPDAARALVTEARQGVGAALEELRDLVRGIRPPVLADRGLEAAIAALADRSPVPVAVVADVDPRPSDPVETAAYFVVAESLTNAAKHAAPSRIDVRLARIGALLVVEVTDDGTGGADAGGHGLRGLRQRVEALDGTLRVTSPVGGPTTIRAELPCAS